LPKLDTLIAEVNDDLKDILAPVAARFRFLLSTVFDYAVAHPSANASTAQTAVLATFTAQYPDGLVSNLAASTIMTAFINRHGTGANLAAKWASVRDWIVAHAGDRAAVLSSYEQGRYGATVRLSDMVVTIPQYDDDQFDVKVGPQTTRFMRADLEDAVRGVRSWDQNVMLYMLALRLASVGVDVSDMTNVKSAIESSAIERVG